MARRISSRSSSTRPAGAGRAKVRRSSKARRTSVPPTRQFKGLGGSFSQLLQKLADAGQSLEQSRRPMRRS